MDHPVARGDPEAVGRADLRRLVVKSPAAEDPESANAACSSRRAVCRRSVIIVVITVLDPLPDIAVHVMEAELVGAN